MEHGVFTLEEAPPAEEIDVRQKVTSRCSHVLLVTSLEVSSSTLNYVRISTSRRVHEVFA